MSVPAFTDNRSRSRTRPWLCAVACAAGCLIPRLLTAQNFNLDWPDVSAGGGTTMGGDYILSATVGQPLAGGMTGAGYAVEAGFGAIVENLGAAVPPPVLRIARAGADVVLVLWPASVTGWVLQESTSPGPTADWTDVSARVVVSGTDNTVMLPLVAGKRFYRLRMQ